jgi:hypothetical protein
VPVRVYGSTICKRPRLFCSRFHGNGRDHQTFQSSVSPLSDIAIWLTKSMFCAFELARNIAHTLEGVVKFRQRNPAE